MRRERVRRRAWVLRCDAAHWTTEALKRQHADQNARLPRAVAEVGGEIGRVEFQRRACGGGECGDTRVFRELDEPRDDLQRPRRKRDAKALHFCLVGAIGGVDAHDVRRAYARFRPGRISRARA